MGDNTKQNNIHFRRILEGGERKGKKIYLKKKMAENIHNQGKETNIKIQEAQNFQTRWIQKDQHQDTV